MFRRFEALAEEMGVRLLVGGEMPVSQCVPSPPGSAWRALRAARVVAPRAIWMLNKRPESIAPAIHELTHAIEWLADMETWEGMGRFVWERALAKRIGALTPWENWIFENFTPTLRAYRRRIRLGDLPRRTYERYLRFCRRYAFSTTYAFPWKNGDTLVTDIFRERDWNGGGASVLETKSRTITFATKACYHGSGVEVRFDADIRNHSRPTPSEVDPDWDVMYGLADILQVGYVACMDTDMLTEGRVRIVRIDGEKHPNADSLSIMRVDGGYPVVYRTDAFKQGELVAYVPVDTLLWPELLEEFPEYAWPPFYKSSPRPHTGATMDIRLERVRVSARKLRGVFSMGVLLPVPQGITVELGQDVTDLIDATRYEDDTARSAEWTPQPKGMPIPSYSLAGLRNHNLGDVFEEGEEVIVTEKIHGCTGRFYIDPEGVLHVASRTEWKIDAPQPPSSNFPWWGAARAIEPALRTLWKSLQLIGVDGILFGEVYGQLKDFSYGKKGIRFAAFDIYDRAGGTFLSYDVVKSLLEPGAQAGPDGIPMAPVIWRGPWDRKVVEAMADGPTRLCDDAGHPREGIVVRAVTERRHDSARRAVLKMHGETFLSRKK